MRLFHVQLYQCVRKFHRNLRHYFLMVSNARIYLSLQAAVQLHYHVHLPARDLTSYVAV
jgi:hypothetical protein